MNKKANKHRPAKRVRPPAKKITPPAKDKPARKFASSGTRVNFFANAYGRHFWEARRGGHLVAACFGGFADRDKARRSLLRLIESFVQGDWKIVNAEVK